jgi:2-polyprenyl-3-methyl-5-hydroxy-6-metoxy-1,4-benzoquinol methylase
VILDLTCQICRNRQGNRKHVAREMMFGFAESFVYVECVRCGCLHLRDVPGDLSRYYPSEYYAFGEANGVMPGRLGAVARRIRSELLLLGRGPITRLALLGRDPPAWSSWLARRVSTRSRILDLGCGGGYLLLELQKQGFRLLTGADAFIPATIRYRGGLTVYKAVPGRLEGRFDVVMLHHSFEHMPDPERVLAEIHRLTEPGGTVLLRIPVADSFAWRTYGTNWVQLDAPRHVFLHTRASIELLASRVGFTLSEIVHDSSAFQFWGSEQYVRGIPLRDPRSYAENPGASMFSLEQIAEFERRSRELNDAGLGDQAAFFLRREA